MEIIMAPLGKIEKIMIKIIIKKLKNKKKSKIKKKCKNNNLLYKVVFQAQIQIL